MTTIRPWAFAASAMPIVIISSYLTWKGMETNLWMALYALINIFLFHSASIAWTDLRDYKHGANKFDIYCNHSLESGSFTKKEMGTLGTILMIFAIIMGLGMLFLCNNYYGEFMPMLFIELAGLFCILLYPTAKYIGLGDLIIFISYAILPTLGTSFAITGIIDWNVLLLAIPLGLFSDSVTHTNNTRDMLTDKEANLKTLPMLLGHKKSAIWYFIEIMVPYVWVGVLSWFGIFSKWTVIIFITFPVAISCGRMMMKSLRGGLEVIASLDKDTAHLELLYCIFLTLGFIIGIFI